MAICQHCNKEMSMTDTCDANKFKSFEDGTRMLSSTNFNFSDDSTEKDSDKRCCDCGIKYGGYHHVGCQYECCPKCGGQWISCGCKYG